MVTVESYFTVVQSVPIGSAAQDWCSIARGLQPHSQLRTTLLQQRRRSVPLPGLAAPQVHVGGTAAH